MENGQRMFTICEIALIKTYIFASSGWLRVVEVRKGTKRKPTSLQMVAVIYNSFLRKDAVFYARLALSSFDFLSPKLSKKIHWIERKHPKTLAISPHSWNGRKYYSKLKRREVLLYIEEVSLGTTEVLDSEAGAYLRATPDVLVIRRIIGIAFVFTFRWIICKKFHLITAFEETSRLYLVRLYVIFVHLHWQIRRDDFCSLLDNFLGKLRSYQVLIYHLNCRRDLHIMQSYSYYCFLDFYYNLLKV